MLSQLLDKTIIMLMCMLLVSVFGPGTAFVTACLFAIVIVLLITLDRLNSVLTQILIIAYMFISLIAPEYLAFMPLMIYVSCSEKLKISVILSFVFYSYYIFDYNSVKTLTSFVPMWFVLLYVLFLCLISIILQYRTLSFINTESKLREIRDNAKEQNMILNRKNSELIEKQDYEIKVATLQERNRIAREIHDNVGHLLTRALLQIGALKAIVKDVTLKPQLDGLHETLNTAMTNIRTSVHDLHDESIDLESSIRELMVRFPKFETSLEYEVKSDVPKNIKYCFITVTKEALNNAVKHSNGDRILIIIREQPGFYQFVIEDNGTEIPLDFTGGIGITNMKERVKLVNGNFNISTKNGFRINISIMK